MATIEERAKACIKSKDTAAMILKHHGVSGAAMAIYIQAATEQDCIARAEEREECVRAAQDWYRNMRNEPKDSQWHDEVENDCVDLRNFIDHKRGSCDSYVTDELYKELEIERERCIKAAQGWLCKVCYDFPHCDHNPNECCQCEAIREAMEEGGEE